MCRAGKKNLGSERGIFKFAGEGWGWGLIHIFSNVYLVDSRNLKFPYHPLLFAHADLNATNILGHVQLLYVNLTIS